jgi:hypothetical protein
LNGKKHGRGKNEWDDGSVYDGNWSNDLADGYGVQKWLDKR